MLGVLPAFAYEQATVALAPGDLLLVYSDGFSEAADARFAEFGDDRAVVRGVILPVLSGSRAKQTCGEGGERRSGAAAPFRNRSRAESLERHPASRGLVFPGKFSKEFPGSVSSFRRIRKPMRIAAMTTALGAAALPLNVAVEINLIVEVE